MRGGRRRGGKGEGVEETFPLEARDKEPAIGREALQTQDTSLLQECP